MSVSVVKFGPYFSSGSISFAQLRTNFAERSSGIIRASDLRRNTNVEDENPIVPDSTENEQISTGSNLRLSQFRNSIKRYVATQSGTDDNASYPDEPGFRMGRYDSNNRGIDWSGGGVSGRDGQNGGTTGNLTKNVQKGILITGTCGSSRTGLAAAQMAPIVRVHNVRIDVSGSILGFGGRGGGNWFNPAGTSNGDLDGENGGIALNFGNVGYNCRVIVGSGCRIWAGGGGGERGKTGNNGLPGTCFNYQYYSAGSGCEWCGSCGDGERIGGCQGVRGCSCAFGYYSGVFCTKTELAAAQCRRKLSYAKSGGLGGLGGKGGNARGYNNQSGSRSGESGSPGQPGNCSGFEGTISTPGTGETGERGGDGGDWGENGTGTNNIGVPGICGKAISSDGGRYDVYGSINSSTVKGTIY